MAAVSLVDKNISQFGHFRSQRQIYLLNKLELNQCNGEGESLEQDRRSIHFVMVNYNIPSHFPSEDILCPFKHLQTGVLGNRASTTQIELLPH